MEEEWKVAVKDYEVSNQGNVRRGDKILKCSIMNCGYKYFQLVEDYKRTNHLIHHLKITMRFKISLKDSSS